MATGPLQQFRRWYDQAGVEVPEAMALATASADGAPSVRMVLLKEVDERGFVFFSNYESRKGRELAANPQAALLFHWPGRQVRVEGLVERVPAAESDAYWATRPPRSRAAAYASRQSEVLASREELERRVRRPRRPIRRVPRTGAATGSPRSSGSSGSTATIACTTACATGATATAGSASVSRPSPV